MTQKLKLLVFIESIVIIFLLAYLANIHLNEKSKSSTTVPDNTNNKLSLLSPRISSGILEPKSFLIVNYAPLRAKLESYIIKNNLNVSIYVENLRSGGSMGINERRGFLPASLNKVPLAILIMQKVEDGRLSMDTMISINDSDRTNTSGSLYKTKEKHLPVRILVEKMLKESDNTAFKTLQHHADEDNMALLLTYLDYYSEESSDFTISNSDESFVTPKSMYNLFSSLYLSTVLNPEDSQYILSLLTGTVFDIKRLAKLPINVTVAQKFGSRYVGNEKNFHSCGIIYDDKIRLFYCIMTKDISEDKAIKIVGLIVNNIYSYAFDTRKKLDLYKELEEIN